MYIVWSSPELSDMVLGKNAISFLHVSDERDGDSAVYSLSNVYE